MKIYLIFSICVSLAWALPNARIIGGTPANAGEYLFAAAITKITEDGNYFCAGSILTNEWVITAGQCVYSAIMFQILIGTHKLSGTEPTAQRLATDTYVIHPEFDPLTYQNDLGLIKFRMPIEFSDYIEQVQLPYRPLQIYATGNGFGWGQVSDDSTALSDSLNYVLLIKVHDEECQLTYGNQLYPNMVCFGNNYNAGTCYGDSGSGIIQYLAANVIIAVASFFSAYGCETVDPSGYIDVYPYNDWIRSVTGITEE